jgi:hypothetical protein
MRVITLNILAADLCEGKRVTIDSRMDNCRIFCPNKALNLIQNGKEFFR